MTSWCHTETDIFYSAGYPATVSMTVTSLDATDGPFGSINNMTIPVTNGDTAGQSGKGSLSQSKKDAAIAVPVIVGAFLAACKHTIANAQDCAM